MPCINFPLLVCHGQPFFVRTAVLWQDRCAHAVVSFACDFFDFRITLVGSEEAPLSYQLLVAGYLQPLHLIFSFRKEKDSSSLVEVDVQRPTTATPYGCIGQGSRYY